MHTHTQISLLHNDKHLLNCFFSVIVDVLKYHTHAQEVKYE